MWLLKMNPEVGVAKCSVETVNQLNWKLLSTILVDLLGSWKPVNG